MNDATKEEKGKEMGEEKNEKPYPFRSLHDFLSELDREWGKFRNGSLFGLISSGFLFVVCCMADSCYDAWTLALAPSCF